MRLGLFCKRARYRMPFMLFRPMHVVNHPFGCAVGSVAGGVFEADFCRKALHGSSLLLVCPPANHFHVSSSNRSLEVLDAGTCVGVEGLSAAQHAKPPGHR